MCIEKDDTFEFVANITKNDPILFIPDHSIIYNNQLRLDVSYKKKTGCQNCETYHGGQTSKRRVFYARPIEIKASLWDLYVKNFG